VRIQIIPNLKEELGYHDEFFGREQEIQINTAGYLYSLGVYDHV